MTRLFPLAFAAALAASPTLAQDSGGSSLFEEGADLFLRGLIEEVTPPLQELAGIGQEVLPAFRAIAEEMGPAFAEVIGQIDSITYYEPPVIARNGDIVIRRRADAPDWIAPEPQDEPERTPESAPEPRDPPDEAPTPEESPGFDLTPPPEAEPDLDLNLRSDGALEL